MCDELEKISFVCNARCELGMSLLLPALLCVKRFSVDLSMADYGSPAEFTDFLHASTMLTFSWTITCCVLHFLSVILFQANAIEIFAMTCDAFTILQTILNVTSKPQ